jgi:hypothetical protein
MMMRRRRKLKTAIYRRLCIILPFSPKSPRAACRLILVGLLLYVAAAIAVRPATAEQKKSEKPYALIFGTVWGPDDHPRYGVRVRIRRAEGKKPRWELYSDRNGEFLRSAYLRARPITWYGPISGGISTTTTSSYKRVPRSRCTLKMTREPTLVCI